MPISLASRSQSCRTNWTCWTVRAKKKQQKPRLIAKPTSGKPSDRPTRLHGKRRNRKQHSPLHNGRPGPPNRRDWTLNAKLPGHGKKKRARRRSLSGRPRQKPQGNKLRQKPRGSEPRQRPQENRPRQKPRGNKPRQRPQENRPRQMPQGNKLKSPPQENR